MSMRTRTRSSVKPTQIFILDQPGSTIPDPRTAGWEGKVESIIDEPHPDYKRRLARGDVILGEFTRHVSERTPANCNVVFGPHPIWGTRTITGDISGYILVDGTIAGSETVIQAMRDQALVAAYAKIGQCDVMAVESLRDAPKSMSMLRKPLGEAQDLMQKIVSKKLRLVKTGVSAAKAISSAWLEYRYGWRPIMMDVSTIMSLHEKGISPAKAARLVVRAGTQHVFKKNVAVTSIPSGMTGLTGTATFVRTVTVNAGVIFDVTNQKDFEGLGKQMGLRASDVPSITWELTPYSFVLDWFVGVGDWISGVTPVPGTTIRGNWITSVDKSFNSFEDLCGQCNVATPPATMYKAWFLGSPTNAVEIIRQCNRPFPTHPVVNPNLISLSQATDGVALACQNVIGMLKRSGMDAARDRNAVILAKGKLR